MRAVRLSSPLVPYMTRLLDTVIIWLAGFLALYFRRALDLSVDFPASMEAYYSLIIAGGLLFSLFPGGVYRSWRGAAMPSMLARVTGRWLLVVGGLLLWLFVLKTSQEYSRIWFGVWTGIGALGLWLERFAVYLVLRRLRRKGFNLRHVALVGDGQAARVLADRVNHASWTGYAITLTVAQADKAGLEKLVNEPVDEVWLALPLGDEHAIRDALYALRHSTAWIRFVPDLFTLRLINHGVSEVVGTPMFDLSTSPMTGMNQVAKLLEDRLLSALILLIISPIMLFVALGVKLSSRGPVFYRQERVGLNGRPFMMLKFRSMPVDTERAGIQWGGAANKTTSRFGQFIRRTSLDELPQFINVLIGDMSIVGPRPERTLFVEQFKEEIPDYMKKHLVKAGITGWAQIHGWRGDTNLQTRIEHDLYYIENWSLWLDIKIIFLTLFKGFINENAY